MKKITFSLILLSSLLTANSVGEFGLGYAKGNNADNYITAFGSLHFLGNFGARLEYTKNITQNTDFSTEDIVRYGLFATYNLPLPVGFSVTPKIGLVKTDGSFKLLDTAKTLSESSTEFTYGLEVNYALSDEVSAFVGYTDYGNKLDIQDIDTSKMDTANYTFGIKMTL